MALLTILEYPDERLRVHAQPVTAVDDALRRVIDDMFETMYAAPGVGLAAPQVNIARRLIVMDLSEEKNQPLVFINPEILTREGEAECEEGCLSFPGVFENVTRAAKILVRALDRHGQSFEMEAEQLLAVCVQHEIDHLEGKLFIDRISSLKRQRARKRLEKSRREKSAGIRKSSGVHHNAL